MRFIIVIIDVTCSVTYNGRAADIVVTSPRITYYGCYTNISYYTLSHGKGKSVRFL